MPGRGDPMPGDAHAMPCHCDHLRNCRRWLADEMSGSANPMPALGNPMPDDNHAMPADPHGLSGDHHHL